MESNWIWTWTMSTTCNNTFFLLFVTVCISRSLCYGCVCVCPCACCVIREVNISNTNATRVYASGNFWLCALSFLILLFDSNSKCSCEIVSFCYSGHFSQYAIYIRWMTPFFSRLHSIRVCVVAFGECERNVSTNFIYLSATLVSVLRRVRTIRSILHLVASFEMVHIQEKCSIISNDRNHLHLIMPKSENMQSHPRNIVDVYLKSNFWNWYS